MSYDIAGFVPLTTPSEWTALGTWLCRKGAHDRFLADMVPAITVAAEQRDVNLIGMIAQSGKETRWGNFGGTVLEWFNNTAGIKVREATLAQEPYNFAQFPSWAAGAYAHAIHLNAYQGLTLSMEDTYIDPRAELVTGDPAVTFGDLGGRWSTEDTYGTDIEALIDDFEALL